MLKLPEEILYKIFEFGGYNTMFIDKFLYYKILSIRTFFRENPLKIKYSLLRWKKKRILYDEGTYFKHRPSFLKETDKIIELSEKIPINELDICGNITPSTILQDKIIPLSETKINYINECGIERIIYWTIYSIKCNNINQANKYKLVWN
jgi:hypothetical protein|uniref:Uncharacterized protein n=1 Tax=viral metagenome TaxID=1070528 RepID=A0A6C0C0Y6_9ZZZZ